MIGAGSREAYEFGGFRLEPAQRVLRNADGEAVKLTAKSFDALVCLVEHAGQLVERSALFKTLWPRAVVEDNNLNQAIAALRRAIGDDHVVTVAGRGYQFVTPVRRVSAGYPHSTSSHPPFAEPRQGSGFPRYLLAGAALVLAMAAIGAYAIAHRPGSTAAVDIGGLERIKPVTTSPGDERTPSLSPDASKVAFAYDGRPGHSDIYVTQLGVGAPLELTEAAEGLDSDPVWSPDGERIAFLRHFDEARFDVVVVPALGGAERTVASGHAYPFSVSGYPMLAWTPNGKGLLFTTQIPQSETAQYAFHLLDLESGRLSLWPLPRDVRDYDTSPAFSPDGRRFAFTRYHRGERLPTLMMQPLGRGYTPEGSPVATPRVAPGRLHSLYWSADGERLRFVDRDEIKEWRVDAGLHTVYTLPPSMTGAQTVAFGMAEGGARAIAVSRGDDVDIWALPLEPTTHAVTGPAAPRAKSTSVERHPNLSPDGRRLAFVSNRSGRLALWVAAADGSSPQQLSDLDADVTGFPRWSPDSRWIAFHASAPNQERQIYLVDVAEGSPVLLAGGCCPAGWSHDGRYLYSTAVGNISYVQRMRVADGAKERLFEGEFAIESADGERLLYAKPPERGVFARALAGSPGVNREEQLVDDYVPPLGGIAPASDGFFYLAAGPDGRPRAFRFFDYASGIARDIAPAPPSTSYGLTLAPDGRELLYSAAAADPGGDLVLLQFR